MMTALRRLSTLLFIAALPLLLITSNVRFVATDVGFSQRGFRDYNAPQRTGIALPELDRAAQEIVEYFDNDASVLRIVVVQDGKETALFNSREIEHMRDVKSLMHVIFVAQEVALVIVLGYVGLSVLWAREHTLRRLALYALIGIGTGLLFVGVIGALAATGFDSAWSQFHQLVFSNDLWKLDPATDHLIQMFPEPFWEDMTFLVGGMTLAESALIAVASSLYLLVTWKRQKKSVSLPERNAAPATP